MTPEYAWIPLATRQPTEETTYPVLTAHGRLRLAWWNARQQAFPALGRGIIITHWYPLPPPPPERAADTSADVAPS
ncbi:MAG TPA: hypothetical protein VGE07_09105 [Herpetosiphonaceae bacterium]